MTAPTLAYIFPFLVVTALMQEILKLVARLTDSNRKNGKQSSHSELPRETSPPGWLAAGSAFAAVLSAVLIRIPVKSITVAGWFLGLNANFSIPLTLVLFSRVWQNAGGFVLLDRQALRTMWVFGLITGLMLYPAALGLGLECKFGGMGTLDLYALGYDSLGLSLPLLALTILLLFMKNRFGAILVVAMLAYNLQLQESPNLWDYLVDPFLTLISAMIIVSAIPRYFSMGAALLKRR